MYMNSKNQVLTYNEIIYWTNIIKFSLFRLKRKTFRIEVLPSKEIIVKAPDTISLDIIFDRIRKRAIWILKQLEYFSSFIFTSENKKHISWETFLYLWRQYILKTEIVDKKQCIKLKWKYMMVFVKDLENTEKIINNWYLNNAKLKFKLYSDWIIKNFEKYDVKPNKILIRKMECRWWSCSRKWNITLNSDLVRAPRWCIEYVLTHEFTHLLEFGHTKRFYDIQISQMPDWEKWKNKLERLLA
jgi:predicted metal-dependent hydrolase